MPDAPNCDLLASLRFLGLTVRLNAGRVLVSPASRLTAGQREDIAARRSEVVAALERETWEAYCAPLDAYVPDFACRSVMLAEIAVVDLGDGRKTAVDAREWEEFCSEIAAWNSYAERRRRERRYGTHAPHRVEVRRKLFAAGDGYHLVEWCLDCNVAAAKGWLSRSAVEEPDAVPVVGAAERAKGLFGGEPG